MEVKHLWGMPPKNSGGSPKFPGGHKVIHRTAQKAFVRVVTPRQRRYVRFKIHSFHACNGPLIKFCIQSLNIIMSCSEIRQSWVLFMPLSCLISDLFRALTFCLLALVSISVATVQTEQMGVFYLSF